MLVQYGHLHLLGQRFGRRGRHCGLALCGARQRRGRRRNFAIQNALMQRLSQRAGISAQFFGQHLATSLIGEQRAGAVARFSLIAHERLIGIFAHLVTRQNAAAMGNGGGKLAVPRLQRRQLQQGGKIAFAQAFALCLRPVRIGITGQIIILI